MSTRISRVFNNLRALVRGRRRDDAELSDELRAYLDAAIDAKIAAGMTRADAERAARVEIGSAAAIRDHVRDVGWETKVESVWTDVRYALRRIRRAPRFSLAVVTTLSLGIGASVALFSAMSAVRFASHRYEDPSRLVTIAHVFPEMANAAVGMSPAEYQDYHDRARTLTSIAAYRHVTMDQTARATDMPSIEALQVTSSLADVLRVTPALGRTFTSDDDAIGAAPVALLSFQTWQREYGGSTDVLGGVIRLDDVPYTIVGVLPAYVDFPVGPIGMEPAPAVWLPLSFTPRQLLDRAASADIRAIARLAPQTSLEQARVDVARIAAAFQQEHQDVYRGTLRLRPVVDRLSAEGATAMAPAWTLMLIATVIVLVTACANVSGLFLVRAVGRRQEIAVRMALGGARRRVLRQLLTETAMLSLTSGLAGYLVSAGLVALAAHVAPAVVRQIPEEPVSAITFAVALSVLIGLICGVGPARRLVRVHAADHVRGAILSFQRTRSGSGQRRFVIVQIATALVLLMGSTLFIRSFIRVLDRPLGFDPANLLVARTTFSKKRYPESERRRAVERAIVETLARAPGVRAAGVTTHLPIADQRLIGYAVERAGGDQIHWGTNALVSPGYFAAMSIPLLAGRTFTEADSSSAPLVAVINETMARSAWKNANPIGERLIWGGRRMTVVGVVGDVHMNAWDPYVLPALYGSIDQVESAAAASASFVVRRDNTPRGSVVDMRSAMKTFDPGLPGPDVLPMTDIIRRSLDQRRLLATTLSAFAAVTTLLAIVGLHGMLAHAVALRTREIGVRLALGARPANVVARVMRDGLFVAVPGLVGGVLVTMALVRGLGALVLDVGSIDASVCAIAIGLLLGLVLLTTFAVARRATRVDPVIALRAE
ncbi:MAG TPA: ABC transporter permease [Vicinamibacterales bacterium]|nr:ABC transporter permease [Vicinamibacterales bacterium]